MGAWAEGGGRVQLKEGGERKTAARRERWEGEKECNAQRKSGEERTRQRAEKEWGGENEATRRERGEGEKERACVRVTKQSHRNVAGWGGCEGWLARYLRDLGRQSFQYKWFPIQPEILRNLAVDTESRYIWKATRPLRCNHLEVNSKRSVATQHDQYHINTLTHAVHSHMQCAHTCSALTHAVGLAVQ